MDFFGLTTALTTLHLDKENPQDNGGAVYGNTDTFYFHVEPGRVRHDTFPYGESGAITPTARSKPGQACGNDRMGMLKILPCSHCPSVKSVAGYEQGSMRTMPG